MKYFDLEIVMSYTILKILYQNVSDVNSIDSSSNPAESRMF